MNTLLMFITIVAWPMAVVFGFIFFSAIVLGFFGSTKTAAEVAGGVFFPALIPTAWLITYYMS